jgi:hypothetical protein
MKKALMKISPKTLLCSAMKKFVNKLPTEELYTIKTIREERKVLTFLEK